MGRLGDIKCVLLLSLKAMRSLQRPKLHCLHILCAFCRARLPILFFLPRLDADEAALEETATALMRPGTSLIKVGRGAARPLVDERPTSQ